MKSRSVLKNKLAVLEMRLYQNNYEIEEILADIPKGGQNRNPMETQYSISCPSFGLGKYTKTFCVYKKLWYLLPLNSDGTSKRLSVHWSNYFKGMYGTKQIPHLVLNMEDNHLYKLFSCHILKHGGNHYYYFDYDEKVGGLIASILMIV